MEGIELLSVLRNLLRPFINIIVEIWILSDAHSIKWSQIATFSIFTSTRLNREVKVSSWSEVKSLALNINWGSLLIIDKQNSCNILVDQIGIQFDVPKQNFAVAFLLLLWTWSKSSSRSNSSHATNSFKRSFPCSWSKKYFLYTQTWLQKHNKDINLKSIHL